MSNLVRLPSVNVTRDHPADLLERVRSLRARVVGLGDGVLAEIDVPAQPASRSSANGSAVTAQRRIRTLPSGTTNPHYAWIEMNEGCNFKCRMCFNWENDPAAKKPDHMSYDEVTAFIRSLRGVAQPDFEVSFTGGEPTLNKHLLDYVRVARECGFKTTFPTHGYHLNEEYVKRMRDAGVDSVMISLDSIRAETHDALRGVPGAHDHVMKALDHIGRHYPGLNVGILTVIMSHNLADVVETVEWSHAHPVVNFHNFQAVTRPFGFKEKGSARDTTDVSYWFRRPEFEHLWPKDAAAVGAACDHLIAKKQQPGNKIGTPLKQLRDIRRYFVDTPGFIESINCRMGDFGTHVTRTGEIYFCFYKDRLGTVRDHPMNDLWFSPEAEARREEIHACKINCDMVLNCNMER